MKTPKTSQNDDFSFSMGEDFEFFPLEDTSKSKEKPPKNAKGYFKNVVASVGRLGTKVAKDLYPEAFSFKDQLMSDTGGSLDIKGTINNINKELKKYGSIAVDVTKEIRKDVKNAITTGNFAKEDDLDMGDMFGADFDFGGFDDDFGGDYDSNESEEPDKSGKKKSRISSQEVTAKSALATANLDIKLTNKQIAANAGITQSHIKQEKLMFAQSISIFQEQHREKMQVMKNIASNLSKVVTQNNLSNRAQMEFSAKQLAFSQDLAALVKEIRNAQWILTKPPERKDDQRENAYQKNILGGGFNLKYLKDQLKGAIGSSGLGSMLGMAKDGVDGIIGFGDMAGGPAKMIKSMIYDSIRQGVEDRLISGNTRNLIEDVNLKMSGLPGAINRKMGQIGRDKDFVDNTMAMVSKLPMGKALTGMLEKTGILDTFQSTVKSIQEVDQVKESTDKYKLKHEDLNKAHPFDNLAHKTLTETIPNILARIDAGVNNTEQYIFDPISNSFKTLSQVDKEKQDKQRAMTESKAGVLEFKKIISDRIGSLKDSELKDVLNDDVIHNMTENIMRNNLSLEEIEKMLSSKDPAVRQEIMYQLMAGAGLDGSNDYQVNKIRSVLRGSFKELKDTSQNDGYNNTYVKLQQSKDSHATDTSNVNMEHFDRYSFASAMMNSKYDKAQAEKQITVITSQIKAKQKFLKNKKLSPSLVKKIQNEIISLNAQLVELRSLTKGGLATIGSGTNNIDTSTLSYSDNITGSIDDYALEDLNNDSSTQGIVKNIYQLLLEGIDVYTHESTGPRKNIEARKGTLKQKYKIKQDQKLATLANDSGMVEFDVSAINEEGSYEKYAYDKGIQLFVKNEQTGKMERIKVDPKKLPNEVVYCRSSDFSAMQARQAKESTRENLKNNVHNQWMDNLPEGKVKKFLKKFNILESGNKAIAGFGSKFLGKHLYGEEYADLDAAEAKLKKKVGDTAEKVKDGVETAAGVVKEKALSVKDKIQDVIKDKTEQIKESDTYKNIEEMAKTTKAKASKIKTISIDRIEKQLKNIKDPAKREELLNKIYEKYDVIKDKAGNAIDIAKLKGLDTAEKVKDGVETAAGVVKEKASKIKELGVKGSAEVIKEKTIETVDTIKTQVPKAMEKFKNKALPGALGKIKMGKTTLMDHLIKINDTQLMKDLSNAETVKEKISVLRNHGSEQALAIANKLDAEVKKRPMIAGVLGGIGATVGFGLSKITGAADSVINKVKERFAGEPDEDGIHGNDANEQREIADKRKRDKAEEQDRKIQEERNESIDKIAKLLDKQSKDGINISDSSAEKIGDAAGSAAGQAGGSGITGKIADMMDKVGLGKYSDYVRKAGDAMGFIKNTKVGKMFGKFPGKGLAVSGGISRIATSTMKGFQHGGIKGGMNAAKKATTRVLQGATKGAAGAAGGAAKSGGLLKSAMGLIKKLFDNLMTKGPLARCLTAASKNSILTSITGGIKKFAGKLTTNLTRFMASYGSVVGVAIPIAGAVAGFTKGMTNAKKYFKVGKGMKVPMTMRVSCGLADALDGLLCGIPGIIAKLAGKESLAVMFYDLISSPESKASLTRYMQYNTKRAKIYGVASGEKLSEYENRNMAQKGLRAIGSFLTGGIVDSNDEKDAKLLGFCSADIYKYWKENKYEPLQNLYEELVNMTDDKGELIYGGKKVVEDFNNDSMVYNDDGEVIEDDEQNQEALDRIDKQNEFRKMFLQQALNKVKELGVAWCTSDCSIQLFEKMTGKTATELQTKGEKFKSKIKNGFSNIGNALKTMIKWSPVGMAFRGVRHLVQNTKWGQKATKSIQDFGSKVSNKVKDFGNRIKASLKGKNLRDMMYKFFNYSDKTQQVMEEGAAEIQSVYSDFIDPEQDPGSAGAISDGKAAKTIPGIEAGGAEPVGQQFVIQTQKLEAEKRKRSRDTKNTFALENDSESVSEQLRNKTKSLASKWASTPQAQQITDKYSKEISEKLDILKQINEEQVRHNDVTEKFFQSCLAMMSVIAKNNNKPQIASEIDKMVQMITK